MDWMHVAQDRDQWRALSKWQWAFGFHNGQGIS